MQMVRMIQKAKELVKKGVITGDFKEIRVAPAAVVESGDKIELIWDNGRQIRFSVVSQLIEFLREVGKNDNV